MKKRIYFDINSQIGRTNVRNTNFPYTTETLLDDLKYFRVDGALIQSAESKDYCFIKGDNELKQGLKKSPRLFGLATVIPRPDFEQTDPETYYDNLISDGVRALRLCPQTFTHSFDPFTIEKLASYMTDKKLPLFIEVSETDWRSLREVLAAFPELNVVLLNSSWGHNRQLFPLLETYPNLYFDISSNQANDILDISKAHFGVGRALFGTSYPYKSMGGLKALVEYSGLSEHEKDITAGLGAMKLLGIDPSALPVYEDKDCMLDEIALAMDNGRPLDGPLVIDSHTHMVDKAHVTTSQVLMLNGDEDNMVKKMDRLGIDMMITSPWEGICTSGISANETTRNAVEKYPGRVIGYATCNPHYTEDLEAVTAVYHEKHRFPGIKPYLPKHKYDLLGDKYRNWFEYGNKNKLFMLVHSGSKEIAASVEKLSAMYPEISFILGHSGISYEVADWNIDVANKRENVFLELTYTSLTNGVVEYLVANSGADRVLYGSDMPMRDPAPQLAWVAYAKLSVEDKKKILGGNMLKIMERAFSR